MKAEDVLRKVGLYYEDDSMELNDDITVGEALQAMEEFARQESERRIDEFIEKVADGYENPDEEVALALLDAKTFKDWLKSLK